MDTLEIAVRGALALKIDGAEYLLEYPIRAIAEAEKRVGHDLKSPADWFCAPASDIPALLYAGLLKNHPSVTEETVSAWCDAFNAEMYVALASALGALNFPDWFAKYKESLAEKRKEANPNAGSAAGLL